jgi:hypothetical protein
VLIHAKAYFKGSTEERVLEAEIQTAGGVQGATLYGRKFIQNLLIKYKPDLCEAMLDAGFHVFFYTLAGRSKDETVDKAQNLLGSWQDARQFTISLQTSFQNACLAKRHPAPHVHDLITKLLTGYSAADARLMPLVDETRDKTIGLNHQPNPQELENIALAKANYIRYRKGTWQEQVLRAVDATGYKIGS